ncbi:hypothetical protein, partial [Paenibacillus sp. FSL H8-0548]|uniref:hypothetical protein n=1 Tax=Paenibacillus sp. FSL H8-0548 TaxID=1920422 RepID=UPI001C4DADAA
LKPGYFAAVRTHMRLNTLSRLIHTPKQLNKHAYVLIQPKTQLLYRDKNTYALKVNFPPHPHAKTAQ